MSDAPTPPFMLGDLELTDENIRAALSGVYGSPRYYNEHARVIAAAAAATIARLEAEAARREELVEALKRDLIHQVCRNHDFSAGCSACVAGRDRAGMQ